MAVLCALATPVGGLLYNSDNPVGPPVLFGGMLGFPVVVGLLTKRPALGAVAFVISCVSMIVGIQHAAPAWMVFNGEVLTSCQVVDKRAVKQRTAPSYSVSVVDCGGRRFDYQPLSSTSEPIGKVGASTSIVVDRTGPLRPVRPSDVTPVAPWTVAGTTLFALLFVAFCVTRPPVDTRRRKIEKEFL
ncbi:hypothetical protein GCM10010185_48040 [Saccharothrix coeruleofusca]|uniref:Uncharacterized protein n=1 Tax=Saccharothrix coeruleofusca TaxID=33919 RepID=A0A918AS99_9PSEU|nr:hypothetical protein GCM10010185_48040 [Saccharothrix coeruleofusca]